MTTKELKKKVYSSNEYDALPTPWDVKVVQETPIIIDRDGNEVAQVRIYDNEMNPLSELEIVANVKRILMSNTK